MILETPTNNNSLVESIKLHINNWISGSSDANESVLSIYIFGSVLHPDKFKRNSDIDLAFLLEQSLYKQDPLLCSGPAYMASTDIGLQFDRQTDVIILNSASIESAYQIVTTNFIANLQAKDPHIICNNSQLHKKGRVTGQGQDPKNNHVFVNNETEAARHQLIKSRL